ncbi:small conductance mechanosensitive channel [Lewinella marina]|uniref:Mechanosensitive ion channel protein MscS n=1 Tax=Neolewinella marina TaxID=438751 RepID=A0A2G0CI56_9BACT|nr:mechanosensitive ion channel family protein [Neolewinella marina]NJB85218.1 small conductance mechanosensitive channel [Neolewinella marina]PHK99649.1 mechanosensitive ion channel protein MscS [Neolewinella marina]
MLLFELFGLELDFQPLFDELQRWWAGFLRHLPNILLAIIVIVVGAIITRFAKKYFNRLSYRMVSDSTVASLISSFFTVLVVLAFLFLTLSVLDLTGVVTSVLAGAGVIGLAVGLAFQDPILNLFSGIMLSVRNIFREGDLIEVAGYFGKVKEVTLRHTTLITLQGQDVMIPNKTVVQEPIKNYSKLKMRRVDLSCGVSYGDDLEKVRELTIQAIKDKVPHDRSKDVQLFFNEFGDSSINYTLRFWLDNSKSGQADYLHAQSEAIMAIKRVYDDNDIMIPFPIRTLDFGIKGGEKLSEMIDSPAKKSGGAQQPLNEHGA